MRQRLDVINRYREAFLLFITNYVVLTFLWVETRWDLFDLDAFWIGALTYYLIVSSCVMAGYAFARLTTPVETKPKLETIPPRVFVPLRSNQIDELLSGQHA